MGIFVSYSSRDKEAVARLSQDLQEAGEHVWLDQRLAGGDAWWRAILEQIRGCDVFVFALSQNSIESKPCQAELRYAQALGLPILPVQVGAVDSMQLNPVATVQTVDYRTSTSTAGMRLLSALHRAQTQRLPLPSPLPPEPSVPFEYLIRLYTTISGTDQLSPRDQAALVTQLQFGLREDGDHDAARKDIVMLLNKLRDREDVTYRTRTDVDAILASVGANAILKTAAQPPSVVGDPISSGSTVAPDALPAGLDTATSTSTTAAAEEIAVTEPKSQRQTETPRARPVLPSLPGRHSTRILIGMGVTAGILVPIGVDLIKRSLPPNSRTAAGQVAFFVGGGVAIAIAVAIIVAIVVVLVRRRSAFAEQPSTRATQQNDDRPLTKRIPDYLRAHPHSTAAAIAQALGSSTDVVSSTLSELKKRGEVNNAVDGHATREWVAIIN